MVKKGVEVGGTQAYSSLWNLNWPTAGMRLGQGLEAVLVRWLWCKKMRKTISVEIALWLAQAPTTLYL